MPGIRRPPTPAEAQRGMRLLQGYAAAYFAVGFAYPLYNGENLLHTIYKSAGLLDEKTYHKQECDG